MNPVSEHETKLVAALAWRATCLRLFVELEQLVDEALNALTPARQRRRRLGNRELRARFALLQERVATRPLTVYVRSARNALAALEPLLDWRGQLLYGEASVWHGRKGQWLITIHIEAANDGSPVRWHAIPFDEAERLEAELGDGVERLRRRLASLDELAA
ncbi:hypothetical protein HMF7854_03040 [Sphingomonas ginkgonis]|uniref:Uncharacterized protein n=1 Tax=Sphingomonas ginkgonis TaxID=2315330 RepID=A0A429V7N7_9SPHN|nr:hypothetical protein [Sphingomonas ginkgonis]RST29912.1 hypothetical protein HMF7854_03040 [Sphingomonas ginkgonis]